MRFQIREKFWALGDDFYILDESGERRFFVDGAAFSWGDKLSFQDLNGNELAYISQRLLRFMPTYALYRGGNLWAEMRKEFSWLRKRFTLDVPGPNDYSIQGSFWEREYEFRRGGNTVAVVSRSFFSLTHTYGVDIADDEDPVAILSACIVIDMILHDERD